MTSSPEPAGPAEQRKCPGGCGNHAPGNAFCCDGCWLRLSPGMRRRVMRVMNAPRLTTAGEAELLAATRALRRARR